MEVRTNMNSTVKILTDLCTSSLKGPEEIYKWGQEHLLEFTKLTVLTKEEVAQARDLDGLRAVVEQEMACAIGRKLMEHIPVTRELDARGNMVLTAKVTILR